MSDNPGPSRKRRKVNTNVVFDPERLTLSELDEIYFDSEEDMFSDGEEEYNPTNDTADYSDDDLICNATNYDDADEDSESDMNNSSGDTENSTIIDDEQDQNNDRPAPTGIQPPAAIASVSQQQQNGQVPHTNSRKPPDVKWFDTCNLIDLDFTKTNELLVNIPGNNEPFDYFSLIVDDDFLQNIVDMTNQYAQENVFFGNADLREHSRINKWKLLTVEELKIFLGLFFHMGTITMHRLHDYWKTDPLFKNVFPEYMSRDRFMVILRCLHFANTEDDASTDPLYKIRFIIDHFNEKMTNIYYPGKNLSLDESMVLWRGRLFFRQYIKNKRHKYGIKIYTLTEPNGLVLKTLIYTGKKGEFSGKGHTSKVVHHLLEGKENNGHSIFMDNFYNSHELAKTLLDKKTYCTGTLQSNRQQNPKDVVKEKLERGDSTCKYSENNVMIGKWVDKRVVMYISTEFKNEMKEYVNKRNKTVNKPLPVLKYNSFMSGIDRKDQMMAYYPCEKKTLRWYKKLFVHYCQMMLLNSYMLWCKYTVEKKMPFYDFRLICIKKLLEGKQPIPKVLSPRAIQHFPTKCEIGENGKCKRKKCRVCKAEGRRKDTIYNCLACPDHPGLCLDPCFKKFHKD